MISDALTWLGLQLFRLWQALLMISVLALVCGAAWALLNWHDPGLVTLKSLLPKADAASLQPPP